MEPGIHIKAPIGVIFYLTKENEMATKALLYELYFKETELYIIETGENLKLEDIFNT
jgi:hypothetical protein